MKRIGIIGGGFSSEFAISLASVQMLIDNFPEEYTPIKIVYSQDTCQAHLGGQLIDFNLLNRSFVVDNRTIYLDYYWIYIHGDPGENGRLQAMFDLHKIPYIGSGVLPSALSFDKWYCNQFLKNFHVPVARSVLLQKKQQVDKEAIIKEIGFPMFVKPTDSGSSYGVSKVYAQDDLDGAIDLAFEQGQQIVIEEFLNGVEVTCAVYQSEEGIQALPLAEIVSENDFFDYQAKYLGQSQEIIPARISEELTHQVQNLSKKIYQIMQLRSVVRMDFMIVDNKAHLIEINTIPGFSSASLVPQMIQKQGLTYRDFLSTLIKYELKKN